MRAAEGEAYLALRVRRSLSARRMTPFRRRWADIAQARMRAGRPLPWAVPNPTWVLVNRKRLTRELPEAAQ